MTTLNLRAPCKINYRLDVLRRRPDGYHDLRMIMQRIDLCDDIRISLSDRPGIRVTCGGDGAPDGPDNIAWRAADALLRRSGNTAGIDIAIEKHIPVAAGLGGGSSDGACVLMGVNELLSLGITDDELMAIGVTLGADVPFFIFKRTALAEGIGEVLTPLEEVAPAWIVLVNPRVPVSTAWVYGNLQLTNRGTIPRIPRFFSTVRDICAVLANDLESVTVKRYPVIDEIKQLLLANGALGALMSGSGPTVFGLFENEDAARRCVETISADHPWFCVAAPTI